MPPQKSDASKAAATAAAGDDGTPVKEATPREGVNVEVCECIYIHIYLFFSASFWEI
jgi:hypothetical protein